MAKITLDDVKDKAVDLAQSGIAKSAQVTEMAKLQINTATEQDTIKKLYIDIGKRYFEATKENPDLMYVESIEKIKKCKDKIASNTQRIKELRNPDIIFSEDKMPNDAIYVDVEVNDVANESADFETE